MSSSTEKPANAEADQMGWWQTSFLPVRKAIVRGLAIMMPPLLTIVLFLWAWNIIDSYVLGPVEQSSRYLIVWSISDIRDDSEIQAEIRSRPLGDRPTADSDGHLVWQADDDAILIKVNQTWIPKEVFDVVQSNPGAEKPDTAQAYYHRFVEIKYLPRHLVIPAFLIVFVLILYLLGRVFAVGFGRLIWGQIESVIHRLPIISKVYSSVKQVTDFAFSDSEIHFTRVVAIEYPRKGLWSIGFVTGESMIDIRTAANEPIISVLMPTSPMPATGFVISVPKSQAIDLDMSIDQAIQWCVSCGVVVPPQQQAKTIAGNVSASLPAPPMPDSELDTPDSVPDDRTTD